MRLITLTKTIFSLIYRLHDETVTKVKEWRMVEQFSAIRNINIEMICCAIILRFNDVNNIVQWFKFSQLNRGKYLKLI